MRADFNSNRRAALGEAFRKRLERLP
jgi:hypothetical protein